MKIILPDSSAVGAGNYLVDFQQRQPRQDLLPCLLLLESVFWYKRLLFSSAISCSGLWDEQMCKRGVV